MFQSTPSGGKATNSDDDDNQNAKVSIHAFRGEGDLHLLIYVLL